MSFIVAIDGPAGSGKGTVTKLVGKRLGLINIDTGATYRCVTLAVIQKEYSIEEKDMDRYEKPKALIEFCMMKNK